MKKQSSKKGPQQSDNLPLVNALRRLNNALEDDTTKASNNGAEFSKTLLMQQTSHLAQQQHQQSQAQIKKQKLSSQAAQQRPMSSAGPIRSLKMLSNQPNNISGRDNKLFTEFSTKLQKNMTDMPYINQGISFDSNAKNKQIAANSTTSFQIQMPRPQSMYNQNAFIPPSLVNAQAKVQQQLPVSSVSSVKSLIALKAQCRPHSRPSTSIPSLRMAKFNYLNTLTQEDFQNIRKQAEVMHSLHADEILDLYAARCLDQKVEYYPDSAVKFIQRFQQTCKHRVMNFVEQGFKTHSAKVLGKIIAKNSFFISLQLQKNSLSNAGVIVLVQALKQNPHIIAVNLASNDVGSDGAATLFSFLQDNATIVSVDLSSQEGLNRNRLGPSGVEPLEWVLKKNQTLQFLNLNATSIGLHGLECIMEGLKENISLISLQIAGNDLGPKCIPLLSSTLHLTNLQELNISGNALHDSGLAMLSNEVFRHGLPKNNIQRLDVSNNGVSALGLIRLMDNLQRNQTMTYLNLSNNYFAGKGISCVAGFLQENVTIKELHLAHCEIGPEGGDSIGLGLSRSPCLEVLVLFDNNIKSQGAISIGQGLLMNESLKELDLQRNRIGEEAGAALAGGFKNHKSLQMVNLSENCLVDEAGRALTEAMRVNKKIKKLNLDKNPISYRFVTEVQKSVHRNQFNIKKAKYPNCLKKVQDLKEFENQKEDIVIEQGELEIRLHEAERALNKQEEVNRKEKQNEKDKNDQCELQLERVNQEFQELIHRNDMYEFDIHKKIDFLIQEAKKTEISIGSVNGEIMRLEFDKRFAKGKLQERRQALQNQVDKLDDELTKVSLQATRADAALKAFARKMEEMRTKVRTLQEQNSKRQTKKGGLAEGAQVELEEQAKLQKKRSSVMTPVVGSKAKGNKAKGAKKNPQKGALPKINEEKNKENQITKKN